MNVKVTVKTPHGTTRYCVLDAEKNAEEQWKTVLAVTPGGGFSVDVREDEIRLVDYFAGETRATFEILKKEETDLPVSLSWAEE